MPKTNNQTGATHAGAEGIVEHGAPLADGRTLSEVNPERALDGTLIPGEHPDAPENADRTDTGRSDADRSEGESDPDHQGAATPAGVKAAKDENGKDGEQSSLGISSSASNVKTSNSSGKSAPKIG